jgi:PAS domain S-box-containing protein
MLIGDPEGSEKAGLLRALDTGEITASAQSADVTARRKDGGLVPIRRAMGHARMGGQDLYVCFITDISERRAMEQALKASEQQFRSLIGNIPGISYRSEVAGEQPMVFVSDAVERITGYPAADFLAGALGGPRRSFGALVHPGDRARVADAIACALRDNRPYLVEYRLLHADGGIRWMWENGTGVRNDAGDVQWLDGVILDMSERHAMEQELRAAKDHAEQAAAARASFVANMSHEIRTPMNAILGFTDVLLDGDLDVGQRRHLDTVRSAGRSLLRLLNEILDTAKLEKGAVELEQNDYNLLSLMDELSSTLAANARAKGLHVDIQYDPDLPTCLRGDELRVRQVLTNLLDNAIKFTERGSVTVRASLLDGALHFEVRDTGIGIAPDRLAAIFEPFTQADASMTRRFGGTGLGTTISKQLVELMGGRIWATSEPGQGTCFHVQLPLVLARHTPQQPRLRTAAALPPLSVLVADDVPQNLELMQHLLARRGHTMTSASDGAAVVALAARGTFDVVLMDFQMPVLDGLSATRLIREQEAATGRARVPVIAMTASVLAEHRRASADAGMDGFASKPVDWYALSHEIARVLGLAQEVQDAELPAQERQVLNHHAGLHRWSGKEEAYLEALAHFERQHGDAAQALAAHATLGEYRALRMQAHKVRGVAANLGMELLADALATAEGLVDGDSGKLYAGADAALQHALERCAALQDAALGALRALQPAAQARTQAPVQERGPDLDHALRAGRVLREALAHGGLDDAALAGLGAELAGHPLAARLAQVHAALADFDFDLAQQQLEAMLAVLAESVPLAQETIA